MAPREARSIAVSNPAAAEAEVELSLGLSVGGVGGGAAAAEDRAAMEAAAARSRVRDREAREAEPISGVRRSASTAAQFPRIGFLPNPNAPAPYMFSYPYPHPHPHQQVPYMPVWNGFRFQYMAPCWSPAPAPPESATAAAAAAGVGNTVNRSAGEGGCAAASPGSSPRTESSSSGVSDQQSGSVRGSSNWSHSRSNSGTSLIEKHNSSSASQSSLMTNTATTANSGEPVPASNDSKHEDALLPRMPCVTTTGNGPNGRTVTGFLYRYTKSEVRILCVCHGRSFSPAEFVEHAGGTDVAHPLRRIVVVPS